MKGLIKFKNVTKEYNVNEHKLKAVDNISFDIDSGEFAVILGPSVAGKSTVLNLLDGMDYATSGDIIVNGKNITGLSDDALTDYRAENSGFVFQLYNLIPTLTTLENIAVTKDIVKNPMAANEILASVRLFDHANQLW